MGSIDQKLKSGLVSRQDTHPTASRIQAAVAEFGENLRRELPSRSALERAAIDEYIDVECQRYSLRLIREQMERSYAVGHVWTLLTRSMCHENNESKSIDTASIERQAEALVKRWLHGDRAAHQEILKYGIDIDEAVSMGVVENLAPLSAIEHQRERLAGRSRLLLADIDRSAAFMAQRQIAAIPDAEILS